MVLINDYGGFFVSVYLLKLGFYKWVELEFMANKPCKKESLTGCMETLKHPILSLFRGTC